MNNLEHKRQNKVRRAARVRASSSGGFPRLSVNISHRHVVAQVIDDTTGKTLAYATTVGQKSLDANLTARAQYVGEEIAGKAKKAKIKKVFFDRGSKLYHGRVKALAEAARSKGLEF